MHEFSIVQSLIAAASEEAERAGAVRISKMICRIGAMRHVDAWLLRESFEIVRVGSVCEDCELSVETTYMQARCPGCDVRFPVKDWDWLCPTCGATGVDAVGGDELELISLEAEVPDEEHTCPEKCVREE